jgi:DNA-binding CsgD family transcriptional regulator
LKILIKISILSYGLSIPDLSVSDYRLAAHISLNLNNKESAAVLNITPGSVKLARHRLRKKLNIDTGEDIYIFLTRL